MGADRNRYVITPAATARPRPLWWIPAVLLALALPALLIDQWVVDALTTDARKHALVALVRLLEPLFALTLWVLLITALPTWKRRLQAIGVIVGCFAVGIPIALLLERGAITGSAAVVVRFLMGGLLWVMILGVLSRFTNGRRVMLAFLVALLLSTLITHSAKWMIGRARPKTDLGTLTFAPLLMPNVGDYESFPSGHSSAAAVVGLTFALLVPRATPFFIVWVVFIGFERIVTESHFPSDVFAGFAVGCASVLLVRARLGEDYFSRAPTVTPAPPNSEQTQSALH
jgi:membrane-associated phospholipid phosphatase